MPGTSQLGRQGTEPGGPQGLERGRMLGLQADEAYDAGMQYTLRNIPDEVDKVLREKARLEQKSLNQVAVEALMAALGLRGDSIQRRDLSDIVGTWKEDPAFDAAIQEQRQIDPELWR